VQKICQIDHIIIYIMVQFSAGFTYKQDNEFEYDILIICRYLIHIIKKSQDNLLTIEHLQVCTTLQF
jgi:hypothetical protein